MNSTIFAIGTHADKTVRFLVKFTILVVVVILAIISVLVDIIAENLVTSEITPLQMIEEAHHEDSTKDETNQNDSDADGWISRPVSWEFYHEPLNWTAQRPTTPTATYPRDYSLPGQSPTALLSGGVDSTEEEVSRDQLNSARLDLALLPLRPEQMTMDNQLEAIQQIAKDLGEEMPRAKDIKTKDSRTEYLVRLVHRQKYL
jgi:hypothetical protein